jgi:hypothetical protein
MSMAYFEFLREEWKQWDTESNFAWFGSCDIVADCWPGSKQVVAQFVWKCGERALAVMLKESYGDVDVSIKGSYCYTACDIFTLMIDSLTGYSPP